MIIETLRWAGPRRVGALFYSLGRRARRVAGHTAPPVILPMPNRPLTRQRVIAELSQIIGLPLTAARRAAGMRMFQFGTLRPVGSGSVGDYALHVQCPWRIEGPDGIVTGRLDLWEPVEENSPFDENWDYEKSPNHQDVRVEAWLASEKLFLVVKGVDADEYGGAAISFDNGFILRLFPAGTRGEDWRLLGPKTGCAHFVIFGGMVESDGEAGA